MIEFKTLVTLLAAVLICSAPYIWKTITHTRKVFAKSTTQILLGF